MAKQGVVSHQVERLSSYIQYPPKRKQHGLVGRFLAGPGSVLVSAASRCSVVGFRTSWTTTSSPCSRGVGAAKQDGLRRWFGTRPKRRRRAKLLCCESLGTSRPALNCADIAADAVTALWGYWFSHPFNSIYIDEVPLLPVWSSGLLCPYTSAPLVRCVWYPIPAARLVASDCSREGGLN